ncbi:MAG: hypothetical protein DHS20C11_28400 [Lysobacteraceae bacterium]|nr:MAG: hypothetical protein DHS20C11_28400 [Xanthomonadaceae bacterium]
MLRHLMLLLALLTTPTSAEQVSDEEAYRNKLAFGEAQLDAMLRDRPIMASGLSVGSPLRGWTILQLAGQANGEPVLWDPSLPVTGASSEHELPEGEQPGRIRIHPQYVDQRQGVTKSFADAWAELVFELHNLAQRPAFEAAHEAVISGRLSRAQWLEAMSRAEHQALLATAEFYRMRWRGWVGRSGRGLRWYQILAVDSDYGRWISTQSSYPEWPFGQWFDQTLAPYLEASGHQHRYNPFIPSRVVNK